MTERPTTAAIQFALSADPSVPGNGRLNQEILAALLGQKIASAPPIELLRGRNHLPVGRRERVRRRA